MIYYLGYYSCEQIAADKRLSAPPAMNKMGYIISVLSELTDTTAMVVSPCETEQNRFVKGGTHSLSDKLFLKTFDSFQSKSKFVRVLGHLLTKAQLYLFLLTHVKAEDTLIVYHSLALMNVVKAVKKLKKCQLIIEVEEVYSDVKEDDKLRQKEMAFFQFADRYIVITELLNKDVNRHNKPRIISHGTYRTVPEYVRKQNDGKIHAVYAGSFNPVKGGAFTAIKAAEYLDEQYVLHILGNGSASEINAVKAVIDQTAAKSRCQIVFDGYKIGKEFDSFIQSCHIGLSTQQPDGKYNASSFPSKILMYMSNGLPVVSVRIPAVETSAVGEYMFYYDDPAPQNIATAIRSVPTNKVFNVRERLDELHGAFLSDLQTLLKH